MTFKRLTAGLLALLLVLSLAACGETPAEEPPVEEEPVIYMEEEVKPVAPRVLNTHLTGIPDYSLPEGATADDMRQMAVRVMHDELATPWYPDTDVKFFKNGPASNQTMDFLTDEIYCGLPYTNGDSSLLHWLQYYDFDSGYFYSSKIKDMNRQLGNSCATSVMWGWNAVCPDMMWDSARNMVPANGCLPVAGYDFPEKINSLSLEKGTPDIIADNTEQQMFTAYANCLPADALVYCPIGGEGNHVVMVAEEPFVILNEDGTINGNDSYLIIQDQRFGASSGKGVYDIEEDGEMHHYSGRTASRQSFTMLLKTNYIPMTCLQFLGEKPYEKATAALETDVSTYDELAEATVRSNYNLISMKMTVSDCKTGGAISAYHYVRINNYFYKTNNKIADKEYALTYVFNNKKDSFIRSPELVKNLVKGKDYHVKIDVLVATGETFTVLDKDITY